MNKVQKNNSILDKIQFTWSKTGKPLIENMKGQLDISVSHDNEILFCVAGKEVQGCDIEPIISRLYEDWIALLNFERQRLLEQLQNEGDSLDRAGTRIWTASEALRKAINIEGKIELNIERRESDSVLFYGGIGSNKFHVLTFPIHLSQSPEKIIALLVQSLPKVNSELPQSLNPVPISDNGLPQQKLFDYSFPLSFKDIANLSRTVYFSNYSVWMGKIRELAIRPIFQSLAQEFLSGYWAWITNHSQIEILGEARLDDVIKVSLWIGNLSGSANSTLDIYFDWQKLMPDGKSERIARSTIAVTWCKVESHGVVKPHPFPSYVQAWVEQMAPKSETPNLYLPLPEHRTNINLGRELYRAPASPIIQPLLREQTFETTLEDANLVGNIYYSNYYIWQGRMRDQFFYDIAPEYFQTVGEQGEIRCLSTQVDHLREAMPFDKIFVTMSLKVLYECGCILHFEYFSLGSDAKKIKLAVGEHKAAWLLSARAVPLPAKITRAFGAQSGHD